jgi:hypothetical protein
MEKISASKALYIKLGREGGFESECLTIPGIARVGWTRVPNALLDGEQDQIDWEAIKRKHVDIYKSKAMATNQTNHLRNFIPVTLMYCGSRSSITFCTGAFSTPR